MAKILLIDDDIVYLDQLSQALGDLSHTVVTATTTDEAMAWLETDTADVIICDTIMQGGGALTLLHAMKGRLPKIPFVVITGRPEIATSPLFERGMTDADAKIEKSATHFDIDRLVRSLLT